MKRQIVVSGISPGPSGVGRVIEYMVHNSRNWDFVYPPDSRIISIKDCLFKFKFFQLLECLIFIFKNFFKTFLYVSKLYFFRNKNLIVLHPQTLKFKKLQRLIRRNNVYIYVMDNSFFCIKSYNYLKSSEKPCLLCLNMEYNNALLNSCDSFPVYYTYDEYFYFINFIKANINRVSFLTQNTGQSELLKKQFGENISIKEIGLLTSDLFEDTNLWISNNNKQYDIVFHGDNNTAKGSKYVYELAKYLPEYTFLFPFECEFQEKLENVDFIKMNWTTGLKSYILDSKLTLCPSIWSAPIEGSVLKTLRLGIALGVFDAEYSFGKEISDDSVLRLSGNALSDVILIREFITSEKYVTTRNNGKNYIEQKILNMTSNYNKIFNYSNIKPN